MEAARADKPPPDIRDEEEKADVARILSVLPHDHPARTAAARGADTIAVSYLVGDAELARQLADASRAGWIRTLERSSHFRPLRVRLVEIDAPELGQAFGKRSRESLAAMCFDYSCEQRYPR